MSEPDAIGAWLTEGDVPINRVGLEIGGLSRWLYIELKACGWPAICIDPRRLRGLTKTMPVKTDRNDPRSIAQVMRIGWFSIVHVKSTGSQELRMAEKEVGTSVRVSDKPTHRREGDRSNGYGFVGAL